MAKINKVFVYGTLKEGGHFAQGFDKVRVSTMKATMVGKLMDVNGFYPGLVEGDGVVHGEVHEYKHMDDVISAMDSIEGYVRHNPDRSLYKRKVVKAETEDGEVEVFAYFFNQPTEGLKEVKNGVWEI